MKFTSSRARTLYVGRLGGWGQGASLGGSPIHQRNNILWVKFKLPFPQGINELAALVVASASPVHFFAREDGDDDDHQQGIKGATKFALQIVPTVPWN